MLDFGAQEEWSQWSDGKGENLGNLAMPLIQLIHCHEFVD